MSLLPKTVSAKDIQRNYRKIFDEAKRTGEPIVVLTNNQPDVAIIGIKTLEGMIKKINDIEMADAIEAIKILEQEKKLGTLKKLRSLTDLID